MAWPKTVPILEADDICREQLNGPGGTHCLMGWINVQFNGLREQSAGEVCVQFEVDRAVGESGKVGFVAFNDWRGNSLDAVARVWNRAMAKLGYVVGNPEAKNV